MVHLKPVQEKVGIQTYNCFTLRTALRLKAVCSSYLDEPILIAT